MTAPRLQLRARRPNVWPPLMPVTVVEPWAEPDVARARRGQSPTWPEPDVARARRSQSGSLWFTGIQVGQGETRASVRTVATTAATPRWRTIAVAHALQAGLGLDSFRMRPVEARAGGGQQDR